MQPSALMLHRLWGHWRLLPPFIGRELREQYAGSLLGVVWSLLQPLLFILLYWWVFAAVLRTRFPQDSALANTPFIVFLLSALLPWFALQEGLNRAASAIISRRDMIRKLHFPAQVFPLAAATAAYIVHGIGYGLFLLALALWQGGLSLTATGSVIVLLALQFLFTAGFGLLLAAFTVYLRDIAQVLGLALTAIFYTAPILYPLTMVPEDFRGFIHLNPFTLFAEAYHHAVLADTWPEPTVLFGLTLSAVAALGLGAYVFRRLEPGFADVL
jgi:ABC-type polysaccharide/polyol phosphate export permease